MSKEHPITKQMQKIAPDVVCIFNSYIERWQVYQVRPGAIMLPAGQKNVNRSLMWTIQTENGSYRDAGPNDLKFLLETVERSHKLWNGDVDRIADGMDQSDIDKEGQIGEKASQIITDFSREAGRLMKTDRVIHDREGYAAAAAADILGNAQ